MRRGWTPAAAALLAAAVAACGGDGDRSVRGGDSAAAVPASAAPSTVSAGSAGADSGAAIAVTASQPAPGTWVLAGTAPGAGPLELTVEDGASVVYGPESVPVTNGRFRIEISLRDAAPGRKLQAFIGDPAGMNQAAVVLNP
ncbi:MAG TPA: hypothetical protein VFH27_16390 [Longimicrobiaceae bacterium]|nr:hypothetical protein [Longimicrobiaceae bacterium]